MADELDTLREHIAALREHIAALEGRIDWLEDYVAIGFVSDAKVDRKRLSWDCDRRKAPVEAAVIERYTRRTRARTDRSVAFDGTNQAELRAWAGSRCALPDERGTLKLIWHGEELGLLRPGDHLQEDPFTTRISIDRATDFDPAPLYTEAYDYERT